MGKGKLIVIEGACDGIGKTTQYKKLYEKLSKDGNVVSHHFPSYNEYQGAAVEKYLEGEFGSASELSPYFVHSLYETDRAVTWYSKLKPMYDQGSIILLDRYTTSTIIYQSALIDDIEAKKNFIDFVMDVEYNKVGIAKPDTILFLYAPFDLVTNLRNKRMTNDGVASDIHERDLSFMKKVYKNALFVAKYLNWQIIECHKNENEMKSIEEIHESILRTLKK